MYDEMHPVFFAIASDTCDGPYSPAGATPLGRLSIGRHAFVPTGISFFDDSQCSSMAPTRDAFCYNIVSSH